MRTQINIIINTPRIRCECSKRPGRGHKWPAQNVSWETETTPLLDAVTGRWTIWTRTPGCSRKSRWLEASWARRSRVCWPISSCGSSRATVIGTRRARNLRRSTRVRTRTTTGGVFKNVQQWRGMWTVLFFFFFEFVRIFQNFTQNIAGSTAL